MEMLLTLIGLYLFLALIVFPIWAIARFRSLDADVKLAQHAAEELRRELAQLRTAPPAPVAPATLAAAPAPVPVAAPSEPSRATPPVSAPTPAPAPVTVSTPGPATTEDAPPLLPPVVPPSVPVYTPPPPQPGWLESVNWEQFMGAKLFAWLGGLALFLGVAFFVKYSFDHGWIRPELRVAMGFIFGAGLIVGGLKLDRARFAITAQTLIATGVVSLYAVTFACNSIYHFAFFGTIPTFLLMVLVTAAAFVLAVRLAAPVVALLGMLGGFLTPVLLSTGVDNPGGLFGYLALLNVGLVAVALRTGWAYLVPLGAGGTVLMLLGWTEKFFSGEKGPVAMTVTLGFSALFLAAAELAGRRDINHRPFRWSAVALPLVGFGYALFFLDFAAIAGNAPIYLGYVLLLDAVLLRQAWTDAELPRLPSAAGLVVFAVMAIWTCTRLTDATLPWALAYFLAFAALHTAFPLVLERFRPAGGPAWWSQLFPPLALVLMLLPLARLEAASFLLWPAILLADVLAIALAVVTASLAAVGGVLVLTLVAIGASVFQLPPATTVAPSLLLVLAGFAVFFFAGSIWLARRLGDRLPLAAAGRLDRVFGDPRAQLPAFSSLLPFLLLVMVCVRLGVPDPSLVFGLGLLLAILTLGLAKILALEWLPLCALAGLGAVEYAWHLRHLTPDNGGVPLVWYFAFYALFGAFPFLFRRDFAKTTGPWATAALAGVVQFPLVHGVFNQHPNDVMGLIPAGFAVLPLLSLAAIVKLGSAGEPRRLNQLAWFGGVALLFVTLIFPVQFDRQWLTIAWALEGVALLWLFHRVPHPGLRLVGVALLAVAFVRLAFNGAVFSYHLRGSTPVFNWYLYAYGVVLAALFSGAQLLAPPRERVLGVDARPLLNTLGVILAFLLLNIEIADYFTPPGAPALTFRFSGNFARDMSYTIGWALFALGLLGAGIWRQLRPARYAAIALLSVALLKLFFHDLARLEALYRIGALFGVAVIAIVASFAYQRFLPSHEKESPPAP